MSAVAARLLPRALPSVTRPLRASAPLARRGLAVAPRAAKSSMEAVRFGADNSIPGFLAKGPKGAPGVIVIQECVRCGAAAVLRRAQRLAVAVLPAALCSPRADAAARRDGVLHRVQVVGRE